MEWRNNLVQNLERKYRTEYFQKSYAALKKTSWYAMVSLILVIAIIIILAAVVIASYKRAIFRKNQELSEYEHYIKEVKRIMRNWPMSIMKSKGIWRFPMSILKPYLSSWRIGLKACKNYWNWHLFVKRIQIIFTDNSRNISRSLPGKIKNWRMMWLLSRTYPVME